MAVRRAAAALLLALVAGTAVATEFSLFPDDVPPSHYFGGASDRGMFPGGLTVPSFSSAAAAAGPSDHPSLFTKATTWTTAGVLSAITAWAALGVQKDDYNPFKFTREKFFGRDTYAGGADKCSHFVLSAALARELGWAYEQEGQPRDRALLLSLGVTVVSGVIQEVGDAFTPYGYSWEDVVADTVGGVAGAALSYYELNDLIGIRFGFVRDGVPPDPCCKDSLGENYSQEVYSGDLKLAGLARRMHFRPGPARFFLLSATYSTRAYGTVPVRPDRQRNVGVDVGLNLPEILSAVGVPETTWWGTFLYKALNVFRIPFTSFGVRYDMNHRKWHGPDTGQKFD
jgi:hypothetical protein